MLFPLSGHIGLWPELALNEFDSDGAQADNRLVDGY
jgi:hypothetical protein